MLLDGEKKAHHKGGGVFENLLDGTAYIVKDIVNDMVVLPSREGGRHIIIGVETLRIKSFYLEKENNDESKGEIDK
jgi:hypothetical protein